MKRILIIEDDRTLRLTIKSMLFRHGYEVIDVESGAEGVEIATKGLADLVLSDINMAGMDGLEVLAKLRGQPSTSAIPFILMTGVPGQSNARQGMDQGADDYLAKPFRMETLLAAVRARFDRQEAIETRAEANKNALLEIVSSTPDLVAIAEAGTTRLRYLNPSGRALLAIGQDEDISSLTLADFHCGTKDNSRQQEKIDWACKYGTWVGESEFVNRVGRRIPVAKHILAQRGGGKEVVSLSVVARDISDRLAAEQAIRESEERYRDLIASLGEGIMVADEVQRLIFANPAAENILNMPPGSLVGRFFQEFLTPESLETLQAQIALRRQGKKSTYEVEAIAGGNSRRHLLISATPRLDEAGSFCGTLAVIQDITERKLAVEKLARSEQLLRTVLDVLPQRVFWKDAEGRYLGANNQFLADAGRRDVIGKTDFEMPWAGKQAKSFREDDIKVLQSGTAKLEIIEQITDSEGKTMWLSTSKVPLRDESGKVIGVLGTYLDLTPLKRAEHERQLMEVQLRQAQKLEAIGQLASGIAHEINTPTQYVGDNTRFLQESFASIQTVLKVHEQLWRAAKANKITPDLVTLAENASLTADLEYLFAQIPAAIGETLEGVERITKIVRAMKEFSHPGGREKSPVNLNKAIESTVTVARNEWKYVAELKLDLDPELPPVPCFLGEFNQAVLNLVINAAHAIDSVVRDQPGTKGLITVSTRRDAEHVEVRVQDTGTGIPEANRPRIFEPFFTTKPVGKGTGQGLSIVYGSIVKKHGGSVRFETEVGVGTTFIIRLPLTPKGEDEDNRAAPNTDAAAPLPPDRP